MAEVRETVKVKPWGKDQGDFVEIDPLEFDGSKHQALNAVEAAKIEAAHADPLSIPSASEEAVAESAAKPKPAAKKKARK